MKKKSDGKRINKPTVKKPRKAPQRAKAEPVSQAEPALILFRSALAHNALEPVVLQVEGFCSYADYLVIVSAHAERHVQAIAKGIENDLKRQPGAPRLRGVEGLAEARWVLLDYGDVVVHIFRHSVREFYDLEGLWSEVPRLPLAVPAENRIPLSEMYSL